MIISMYCISSLKLTFYRVMVENVVLPESLVNQAEEY